MKKQIMSIAAAAALFTTGAMAFDATQGDGQLMKETGATSAILGTYSGDNAPTVAVTPIAPAAPGQLGDALIYPAFFGENGFSTEFSVINTSSTEAVIAKVVLYSAIDSKELRDFNIYLSANDVFRATIKDGKITSTDGSTVVVGSDSYTNETDHEYNHKDASEMASTAKPFETDLDEQVGYIAVFAMVQVDEAGTDALQAGVDTAYHKKHNELWRDYRHLLDQCRTDNWRGGITNGIYTGTAVNQPNIDLAAATPLAPLAVTAPTNDLCSNLSDTVQSTTTTGRLEVMFKAPDALLTGSLTVLGNDSKGTRAMTIKPVPYTNFSDGTNTVLWTEGELASIADRCIDYNVVPNQATYDDGCIDADAGANTINGTLYEFGSLESKLLVTQPWKRTIIQMHGDGGFNMGTVTPWSGVTRQTVGNGIAAGTTDATDDFNVKNYGGFKISQLVYNDDEDKYIGSSGGFTVSPASTAAAGTIPNEMSMFDPLPGGANYEKGYAAINYVDANMHGIVTQMTAHEIDGTAEINWLYPFTN